MRAEELFEIIDGIDDDLILDIPRLKSERPTMVVIEHRKTPIWAVALLAACLVCVLAVGVFVAAKLQNGLPVFSGSNDPGQSDSSDESSSGSDSDSDSGSEPDIEALIENFPVDYITFPNGSTVSKYEASWAKNEDMTYQLGFDYSFIRYAEAPLYTTLDDPELINWETGEFKEKPNVYFPQYYKVKAGDVLPGLTVKSASYTAIPNGVTQDTITFTTGVEFEGQLTLSGVLYCYSGDNLYINGTGKYMFFADPSQSDPIPITSIGSNNDEVKMGPLDFERLMGSSFKEDKFAALGEEVMFNFSNIDEIEPELAKIVSPGEAKKVSITVDNIGTSFALTVMRYVYADLVSVSATNEKVEEFIREIELSGRGRPYVGSTRHFEKMFVDFDGTEIYLPIQNTDFLYQHPYTYSLLDDSLVFARFSENSPDLISIFLTTDKGKSWQYSELNVENADNYSYYISFQSSGKGFLVLKSREDGDDHITYTSEDFGKSWNPASFIPNSYVTWIGTIQTAGDYFWVAGEKNSYPIILKSDDGINWKEVQLSLDTIEYTSVSCTDVYFSNEIGLAVLKGETGDGKRPQRMWYFSEDHGETWSYYKTYYL